LKYLIDVKRAEFTVPDNKGFTTVHCAVLNGHLGTGKYLLDEKRVDFKVCDHKGFIPTHSAASRSLGNTKISDR
jgi:ankyrin repeat protein